MSDQGIAAGGEATQQGPSFSHRANEPKLRTGGSRSKTPRAPRGKSTHTIPVTIPFGGGLTVSIANTDITLYVVSEDKLDNWRSLNSEVNFFLAIAMWLMGNLVTLLVTLFATKFTDADAGRHTGFVVASLLCGTISFAAAAHLLFRIRETSRKYDELKKAKASLVM